MPSVGQQQILGALVPDININKITLENSPTLEKRRGSDRISAHGSSLEFIEGYQAIADQEKNLRVTLNMSIKDQLDNGSIATWFTNQDIHQFLTVVVVQSIDPFTTKMLSASNNAIQLANFETGLNNNWEQPGGLKGKIVSMAMDAAGDPEFKDYKTKLEGNPDEIWSWMEKHITAKVLSFAQIVKQNEILDLMDKQYGAENTKSFDVPFNLEFKIKGTPKHLAYFAVTMFDLAAIQEKFGIHFDDPFFIDMMTGNTVGELVIDGSRVVSQSYIYRTVDGTLYTGPVEHLGGDWWPVGSTPESREQTEPLIRDVYPHSKIQDFRVLERLKDTKFAFASNQANLLDSIGKYTTPHSEKASLNFKKTYFSGGGLSVTTNQNVSLTFAMSWGNIIRDNARFAKLFNATAEGGLNDLISEVKIVNLTLKRRRVTNTHRGLNSLGTPTNLRNIFNESEQVPVVIATGYDVDGKLKQAPSSAGMVKESKIETFFSLLESEQKWRHIRHFEAVDLTMRDVTDGHYQYGVEIEIKDNTHKKIFDMLNELKVYKASFDEYAMAASVPTAGNNKNESSITTKSGYGLSASKTLEKRTVGAFDQTRNRFTDKFINEQNKKYTTQPGVHIKPWEMTPWAYFTFLSIISGGTDLDISQNTMEQLVKSIAPETGTPQGIGFFQKILDDLVAKVSSYINSQMAISSNRNGTTKASMPLTPSKRTFIVSHWFGETWDSNLPPESYDYLSAGTLEPDDPTVGLKNIQLDKYENICNAETLKHWNTLGELLEITKDGKSYNTGDNLEHTKWTYLTPSNVDLGDNGGCFQVDPFNSEKNSMMKSAIAKLNQTKQSPFLPIAPFLNIKEQLGTMDAKLKAKELAVGKQSAANLLITKINVADILSTVTNLTVHTVNVFDPLKDKSILLEGPKSDRMNDPWVDATKNLGDAYDFVDPINPVTKSKESNQGPMVDEQDTVILLEELASDILDLSDYGLKQGPTGVKNEEILNKKFRFYDHSFYNLNKESNAIEKRVKDIVPRTSMIPPTDGNMPPHIQEKFINMPNQIKSLFVGSLKPEVVKNDMFANNGAYFNNPINHASIIFNYKMIRKVEVLSGYELDESGTPMLKKPLWIPLDDTVIERMSGKDILCRHIKYTDVELGIETPNSMKLPVYNRYFSISIPPKTLNPASL